MCVGGRHVRPFSTHIHTPTHTHLPPPLPLLLRRRGGLRGAVGQRGQRGEEPRGEVGVALVEGGADLFKVGWGLVFDFWEGLHV